MSNGKPLVLMAFANSDSSRPLENLQREERGLRAALQPLVDEGKLDEPLVLRDASIDGIARMFQDESNRGRVRVFHYGGHANEGMLMLVDDEGGPAPGHGPGLADFLGRQKGLELVVLNGCSTQAHIDRLVKAGVRAVVATSRDVMDDVAADFAPKLFGALAAKLPLKRAFDDATALLRTKRGQNPRAFVHGDHVVTPEWTAQWPWMLSCESKDEGWTLMEEVDLNELVKHLAKVLPERGMARVVLSRIGFPREQVPEARTSSEFWNEVVDELQHGMAKVQALIDEVSKLYPGNTFFNRYRS